MSPSSTTKTSKIAWKIIEPSDIMQITNFVFQEYKKEIKNYDEEYSKYVESQYKKDRPSKPRFSIDIELSNNINQRFDNIDSLMEFQEILDTRKITEISIKFSKAENYISIALCQSIYCNSNNYFKVTGIESTWVNGIFASIKDIFDNSKDQNQSVGKHPIAIFIILDLLIGFILNRIIALCAAIVFLFVKIEPISINSGLKELIFSILIIMDIVAMMGMGFFPAQYVQNKISALYPCIEINTGPKHLQSEKEKREKLWLILSVIIIPFLFFFFSYILTLH